MISWKANLKRILSLCMVMALLIGTLPLFEIEAKAANNTISNDSIEIVVGDLGQIREMYIKNNLRNINFVLPNTTSAQNTDQHQWMGEMIFSTRSAPTVEGLTGDFVEVDTNKTLAAGGSTTASNISANNPYISKTATDSKVEVNYSGLDISATTSRAMKGFDVKSVFDTETDDGSLLWEITLTNKSDQYIEFGDVGMPMPWNNKYTSVSDTYQNRVTTHTFAGADSGYAYAIRPSGEGNFMLFTPVVESGARIEYVEHWQGQNNGVAHYRNNTSLFNRWTENTTSGWTTGLAVYYVHSKDISAKTGQGYFTDNTSLILAPGESETYQFKFSAVRAGDNSPQESASSPNNASNSVEERETNMRSILYKEGLIDAVAVPGFQTSLNMPAKLDLHYDDSIISDMQVSILCVHENDPFDLAHIPNRSSNNTVSNSRGGRGLHDANDYERSVEFVETVLDENGEQHHIYNIAFDCIGNNSVRVDYKVNGEDKFTQYEFNVLTELDDAVELHADFILVNQHEDENEDSSFYGTYYDWFLTSGLDTNTSHWADDWSHSHVNFMAMKNYMNPDEAQIQSLERYLIDFLWENEAMVTQSTYRVRNTLSGGYSSFREYAQMMALTGFYNMYRIQKAYPDLMEYRQPATWYLEKAYGMYRNQIGSTTIGFYGEQQVPGIIEALWAEGMDTQAQDLQTHFAYTKGRAMANTTYPYGSEFEYDNTGDEGAYAANKALRTYYPNDGRASQARNSMEMIDMATRARRGIQPTWYHYGVPVFRGGEGWWNFQYTASLAGYVMDDWLRYENDDWDTDTKAWAERVNYSAKISNFNAINMGQISADSIGSVSWRYSMFKGGFGAMNVNDNGTRLMSNGWNDFSGEADEGIYGSLLSISADVVTDPLFGLYGYGAEVEKVDGEYTVVPQDGFGKRINLLDENIYVEMVQDRITEAVIAADGSSFKLQVDNQTGTEHIAQIKLSGSGIQNGYYSIKLDGEAVGQVYVMNKEGTATFMTSDAATFTVSIEKMSGGTNQAPTVSLYLQDEYARAYTPYMLNSIVIDDGAPNGTLSYTWEVLDTPELGNMSFEFPNASNTTAIATLEGDYTIRLTVSDGEHEVSKEATISFDYGVAAADKTELKSLYDIYEEYAAQTNRFESGFDQELQDYAEEAYLVLRDSSVSQDDVDTVSITLLSLMSQIVPMEVNGARNIAFMGGREASYTSGWEALNAINNNNYTSLATGNHWGTWGNIGRTEYLQYNWPMGARVDADNLYVWTNADTGIRKPTQLEYLYLPIGADPDNDDAWVSVLTVPSADINGVTGQDLSSPNPHTFEPFECQALRVVYTKDGNNSNGVGAVEWQVFGEIFTTRNIRTAPDKSLFTSGNDYTIGENDGTILISGELKGPVEISRNEDGPWISVPEGATEIEGLKGGNYYIRYAETAAYYASPAVLVGPIQYTNAVEGNNVAPAATLTAHSTCRDGSDARLSAINDRSYPTSFNVGNGFIAASGTETANQKHAWHDWGYGDSLGSEGGYHGWITFTWNEPINIFSASTLFFADGGGILVPASFYMEYWDGSEWKPVEGEITDTPARATWADAIFEPVTTTRLRLNMISSFKGLGIFEVEVYEYDGEINPVDPVDKEALNALITEADALEANDYTAESYEAMQEILEKAKEVAGSDEATQEDVTNAYNELKEAIDALVEKDPTPDVDKDALNALIAQAEGLDPDDYTEESYDAMLEVLEEAKGVAADNNATQEEVDEAAEALQEAIDALEPADEEDIPVISIDLNAGSLNMLSIGNTLELNPTILPENATDKTVTYTSNNPNVASVDEDGVVTAHKTGTALITATASSGKVSKTTVRVTY